MLRCALRRWACQTPVLSHSNRNFLIVSLVGLQVFFSCVSSKAEDRTYDGTGNNLAHPTWGSAGSDYIREASGAHYADGISSPLVVGLPSARDISNVMMTQGENSVVDPRGLTAMIYTWGQF